MQIIRIVLVLMYILTVSVQANAKYAGASLLYPNCDTGADPNTDNERMLPVDTDGNYHYTQSCVNHNNGANPIDMNNFAIKIRFDPAVSSAAQGAALIGISAMTSGFGSSALMLGGGAVAIGGSVLPPKDFWLTVGKTGGYYTTAFSADFEGDMACVYAMPLGMFRFPVDTREDTAINDGAEPHCFMMPPPRTQLQPPKWNGIISPTCSNFCNLYDHDGLPQTPDRKTCASKAPNPFIGVVVQCVTETMDNLFYSKDPGSRRTVFAMMQERLKDILKGLLTMYVIFIGYQFIMRKGKVERAEFIWYFLRFALVWYFAAGDGLLVLKPALDRFTTGVSSILIEAGFGTSGDFAAAQQATNDAQKELDQANDRLLLSRKALTIAERNIVTAQSEILNITNCANYLPNVDSCPPDIVALSKTSSEVALRAAVATRQNSANAALVAAQTTRSSKQNDFSAEKSNYTQKAEIHRKALSYEGSFGYNLCDYRDVSYGDKEGSNIIYDRYPDGSPRIRDMSYMKLWDMVDCRLMKYLGVGDYTGSSKTPQVLLIGVAMLFTNAVGLLIFLMVLIFLVFIILLIFRIAHIYLMAVIALNIIIYIGPLFIPSVLFSSQKSVFFDKWLKQVISYTMQPILLFAFLTFLFASFDQIIYGGNHMFYKMNYGDETSTSYTEIQKVKLRNQIVKYPNPEYPLDMSQAKCPDEDTIGCIFQSISEKYSRTSDFGFGSDFTFLSLSKVSTKNGVIIFLGMLKLFIIAYVLHSVLATMEDISVRITDAMGGGAAKLSGAPSPGLTQSAQIVGGAAKGAGKLAGFVGGAVVGRVKGKIDSARSKVQAMKQNDPKNPKGGAGGTGSAGSGGGGGSSASGNGGSGGTSLPMAPAQGAAPISNGTSNDSFSAPSGTESGIPSGTESGVPSGTESGVPSGTESGTPSDAPSGTDNSLSSRQSMLFGDSNQRSGSSSTDPDPRPITRPGPPPPPRPSLANQGAGSGGAAAPLTPRRPAPPPPTSRRPGVSAPKTPTRPND